MRISKVHFGGATFSGSTVNFLRSKFNSGEANFDGLQGRPGPP
ncbi:hypothetical protein ACPCVO_48430 [Streptomyces umbrinus]